jgi:hypothetical protein
MSLSRTKGTRIPQQDTTDTSQSQQFKFIESCIFFSGWKKSKYILIDYKDGSVLLNLYVKHVFSMIPIIANSYT